MKRFKKKSKLNIVPIIIIFIIFNTILFLNYINKNISPKLLEISTYSIETYNNKLIMDFISNDTLSKSELNELMNIVKNSNNEIIAIDYDTNKSYQILKSITDELYEIVSNTSYKDITDYDYDIKDDLIIYYPIFLASNYAYFNNLGPKIPVKIKFLSSLVTNLNTKVSSYGINNVLLEVYVNIEIVDDIVIPFKNEPIKKNYDILLSSKVIMGSIPSFLGTTLESQSPILQK